MKQSKKWLAGFLAGIMAFAPLSTTVLAAQPAVGFAALNTAGDATHAQLLAAVAQRLTLPQTATLEQVITALNALQLTSVEGVPAQPAQPGDQRDQAVIEAVIDALQLAAEQVSQGVTNQTQAVNFIRGWDVDVLNIDSSRTAFNDVRELLGLDPAENPTADDINATATAVSLLQLALPGTPAVPGVTAVVPNPGHVVTINLIARTDLSYLASGLSATLTNAPEHADAVRTAVIAFLNGLNLPTPLVELPAAHHPAVNGLVPTGVYFTNAAAAIAAVNSWLASLPSAHALNGFVASSANAQQVTAAGITPAAGFRDVAILFTTSNTPTYVFVLRNGLPQTQIGATVIGGTVFNATVPNRLANPVDGFIHVPANTATGFAGHVNIGEVGVTGNARPSDFNGNVNAFQPAPTLRFEVHQDNAHVLRNTGVDHIEFEVTLTNAEWHHVTSALPQGGNIANSVIPGNFITVGGGSATMAPIVISQGAAGMNPLLRITPLSSSTARIRVYAEYFAINRTGGTDDAPTWVPAVAGGIQDNRFQVRIPMLVRTLATEGNVTLTALSTTQITQLANTPAPAGRGLLNTQTGAVNLLALQGANRTIATATNQTVHRDTLTFNLNVREAFVGAFPSNGVFELIAPSGFSWGAQNLNSANFAVANVTGTGSVTAIARHANNTVLRVQLQGFTPTQQGQLPAQITLNNLVLTGNAGHSTREGNVYIEIRDAVARGGQTNVGTVLQHQARQNANSPWTATVTAGWPGLPTPPAAGAVRNFNTHPWGTVVGDAVTDNTPALGNNRRIVQVPAEAGGQYPAQTAPFVATQTGIFVGEIGDWRVEMETVGTIPELISGRLIDSNIAGADAHYHRAVRVRVTENIVDSLWAERVNNFVLTEGIRVREVVFNNVRNVQPEISNNYLVNPTYRHFNINNFASNRHVLVNHGTISLYDLRRIPNQPNVTGSQHPTDQIEPIQFYMDIYLNIPVDFEGDINLYLNPTATQGQTQHTSYVTIAEAVRPIEVTTDVRNVRVGYQFMPIGNFSIRENVAGALRANEEVFVTITDGIFSELHFAPNFNYEVTEGNLRIDDVRLAQGSVWDSGLNPQLIFYVDQSSSQPSTIEFTNVSVRLAAVAPASTDGYDLIVWGPAVAQNTDNPHVQSRNNQPTLAQWLSANRGFTTGAINWTQDNFVNPRDLFSVPGISELYVTLDGDFVGAPTVNEIVTISADGTVTVGGQSLTFDPSVMGNPVIADPGVLFIPARLSAAILFGLTPQEALISDLLVWDAPTSTFIVDPAGRNIRLTVGSSTMFVGGIPRNVLAGEGANAIPTSIFVNPTTERMYLPGRALAEALGFDVTFADGVATFTPQGYTPAAN